MNKLISPSFWLTLFMNTLLTMFMIYLIKTVANKWKIPVVTNVVNEV